MSLPEYGERRPPEKPKSTPPAPVHPALTWFWVIALLAVVVAPLSIFLIRLALGLL